MASLTGESTAMSARSTTSALLIVAVGFALACSTDDEAAQANTATALPISTTP